jgi:glucose-1-phosphate adenylyltransferase
VEYSILMPNVVIGRNSRIRRAIIDTNVKIPESSTIGFDADDDRRNGHHITDGGIVVVSGQEPQAMQSARSSV